MVFKRYQFQILFRLLLIVANCFGAVYVWQLQAYWISFYNLILLLSLQVYLLFRYLTRWEQDIGVFANSVKHGDYNITYHLLNKNDAHFELYRMLNSVAAYVRTVKSEAEQQHHYFQYIVENAQVGLMAYDDNGKIILSNDEALKLLGVQQLKIIHQLQIVDPVLYTEISGLGLNQAKLLRSSVNSSLRLSARLSKIVINGQAICLLSLINIKSELEENELQSWQDLISVLTHEIMNSVTPIHSLTGSMNKYLDRISDNEENVSKAKHSLDVIYRRSQSLMSFVDRYRQISTVPLPRLEKVDIAKLIGGVLDLMENDLKDVAISFDKKQEIIEADPSLLEQVLINLIKNSITAVSQQETKKIEIKQWRTVQNLSIAIADNGKGIPASVAEKIFIPFFTTKDNGSGIGLTLSRQIMQRHGGTIEVQSKERKGTTVVLMLPAQQ